MVIGTRSAVFAPTKSLGLIVIDEEQENSFKELKTPRYHAREVALWRVERENAVLIIGSATPSLETYHRSMAGEFRRLELTRRIDNRPLPPVEIVDMRQEQAELKRYPILSRRLKNAIRDSLQAGGQVILFLNRRGFATYVNCLRCGYVLKCERCDVPLTYHREIQLARCHHCGRTAEPPETCPECTAKAVRYFGVGTQRVEDDLLEQFDGVRVLRMDVDTTRRKGAHDRILASFGKGEADILL